VIRCNNCGTINPDTITNCQNCMALLPTSIGSSESGPGPRANTQDQPELPAWLESLRAGDHPAAAPKNFSSEDMAEEGKVPSWLQPNRSNGDDKISNSYPSMRSSTSPAPDTDAGYAPARNISANSLIDANSLPSWMQPEQPKASQQNIAASSLVQPEFAPDWMKSLQSSTQNQSSVPVSPQQQPPTQQIAPTQGFSAHQLIDQQALPNWMRQGGGQNYAPPIHGVQSPQQPSPLPYTDPTGQAGLAASSLLDMNSLPSWIREDERDGQERRSSIPQQPTWQGPQQSSSPSWQMPQQPPDSVYPLAPNSNSIQGSDETLAMGSLIDMNTLPDWLRSAAEAQHSQQRQQGQNSNQQRSSNSGMTNNYGTPPRIENIRVPSRPRGEVGASEGSEVAANVFASMLGVASNAPQYQAQQQQGYAMPSNGQLMGNVAPPNQVSGTPEGQRYSTTQLGPQSYGQGTQMGYSGNMQPGLVGQNNYLRGGNSTPPLQNNQRQQGMMQPQAQNNNEKATKKGGLFEAIRNFFFRQ